MDGAEVLCYDFCRSLRFLAGMISYFIFGGTIMNTNELSNIQVIAVLAVLFFLMFVIYKTVMITQNKKNKIVSFSRKTKVSKPKTKTTIKVKHDTSVFNFTNDSKADYIQSCWDELNK